MTELRVATYNLLSGRDVRTGGRFDLEAAAEAIKALEVDVVALQEVDRGLIRSGECDQVAELATCLGCTGIFAPALLGDPTLRWARGPGAPPAPLGSISRRAAVNTSVKPPSSAAATCGRITSTRKSCIPRPARCSRTASWAC